MYIFLNLIYSTVLNKNLRINSFRNKTENKPRRGGLYYYLYTSRRFSKPIDLTTQISSFSYQFFFIIQSKYNVQRVRFRNKIENPSRNMVYRT